MIERLMCGLVASYGESSPHGHTAATYDHFIRSQVAADLMVGHEAVITPSGVVDNVGTWRCFCHVTAPVPGLLGLAVFGQGDTADRIRQLVADDMPRAPRMLGLSIGGYRYENHPGQLGLCEVSLTPEPADPYAAVLGLAARALHVWELLTGQDAGAVLDQITRAEENHDLADAVHR